MLFVYAFIFIPSITGVISGKVAIDFHDARPIRKVPAEFLSVALDSGLIKRHWGGINWRKAIILTSGLSPAYLRVGGTNADLLFFNQLRINETSQNASTFDYEDLDEDGIPDQSYTNFSMSAGDFDRLNWFSKWSNLSAIFDLNVLIRTPNDHWDWRANAKSLMDYVQNQRHKFHWELGNEPNSFGIFNRSITPRQLAQDYSTLKSVILTRYPFYANSKIIGPSVSNLKNVKYFEGFLQNDGARNVDALTFHQYYFDGSTATIDQFINATIMNSLIEDIAFGRELIRKYVKTDFPFWLGETSSAYGGGAKGLSDSFVAGFLWLDKLGLSAILGLDVVIRQTLFGGQYSLLDVLTDPNPDYWLSLLYKKLVDTTVIKINVITNPEIDANYVRFYGHCSQNRITIFGMNLLNDTLSIDFITKSPSIAFTKFILSAPNGDLRSKIIHLNGRPLIFDGTRIPELNGVKSEKSVIMPAYSMAFFVFDNQIIRCD